jgi:hypothetical protein
MRPILPSSAFYLAWNIFIEGESKDSDLRHAAALAGAISTETRFGRCAILQCFISHSISHTVHADHLKVLGLCYRVWLSPKKEQFSLQNLARKMR